MELFIGIMLILIMFGLLFVFEMVHGLEREIRNRCLSLGEGLGDIRSSVDDLRKETVRSVNGLDDLYQAVSELEKAGRTEPERRGGDWMEEGMDNLLSYMPESVRKGASRYEDGAGDL